MFRQAGVLLPLPRGGVGEQSGTAHCGFSEDFGEPVPGIVRVYKDNPARVLVSAGEPGVVAVNGPTFVQRGDAVAEPAVNQAFSGEQRGKRFAALVHIVNLAAHHPGHHALPPVGGLDRDVGHAGDKRRTAGQGHFHPVGMSAADNVSTLEHGDGAVEVESRTQLLRVMGQPVAVGPGLSPQPRLELLGGYRPHFLHGNFTPPVGGRRLELP